MSVVQTIKPKHGFSELFFPEEIKREISALIEEEPFSDALIEYGLGPRRKILLHGESGCGKTSIAHALAKELGMQLMYVAPGSIFGSSLGTSEKNMTEVFKSAKQNRCVLLIDEFDSFGSSRVENRSAADGEQNRVVNVILTELESLQPLGFVVACTNHLDALDPAIIRRFDLILEIPKPDHRVLEEIANSILKGHFGLTAEDVLKHAQTPALVALKAKDILRAKVIENEKQKQNEPLPLFDQEEFLKRCKKSS